MSIRRLCLALGALAVFLLVPFALLGDARGAPTEAEARAAWQAALKRGAELWNGSWGPGSKACVTCHGPGPNRMRGGRVDSYPKFDAASGKVITVQQKLNDMIRTQSLGKPLPLGSDDLTALEAYLGTIR